MTCPPTIALTITAIATIGGLFRGVPRALRWAGRLVFEWVLSKEFPQ